MLPKLNLFNYRPISAPEPLDAYKAAIDDAVQTYDKNLQEAQLIDIALSKVKALPSDKEYVDKVRDKIKGTLSNLAGTIQGNKRWDLANDTLNELKLTFASDQNLQGIQESYNSYLGELELEQKLKANGKTPVNLNLVDWKNHRTISPDGQLNIYRSNVQPKADYNAEMFELAKTIQPDIDESGLRAAGYDGFLLVEKVKELSDKKIKENLPALFRSYANTDTYQQQKQIKLKELYQQGITGEDANEIANQQIAQDLKDIASLRVFKEKDKTFMQDPTYRNDAMLDRQKELLRYKAELKHGGQSVYDGNMFREATEVTKDGKNFDRVRNIGNGNVIDNLTKIVGIPSTADINLLDDKSGIDLSTKKIKKFIPKGLATVNRSGNDDWNGSWKGDLIITDADGKNEQTVNAYVKNHDKGIINNFKTINDVAKAIDDKSSKTTHKIKDVSGLISIKNGDEILPASAADIELEVIRYADGKYKVKPVQYNQTTKQYNYLPSSYIKKYGLKENYTIEELEDRSLNNLEPFVKTLSLSDKQVSEQ